MKKTVKIFVAAAVVATSFALLADSAADATFFLDANAQFTAAWAA